MDTQNYMSLLKRDFMSLLEHKFEILEQNKKLLDQMSLFEYEIEALQQNIKLLDRMSKCDKNSGEYKLLYMQYHTNIAAIELNKKLGYVLVGQNIE